MLGRYPLIEDAGRVQVFELLTAPAHLMHACTQAWPQMQQHTRACAVTKLELSNDELDHVLKCMAANLEVMLDKYGVVHLLTT